MADTYSRKAFGEATKAAWADDACAFKSAADQVSDVNGRLDLLNAVFGTLGPPGYKFESKSSKSDAEAKISGPSGAFYELKAHAGASGNLEIVDEKPSNCR